MTLMLTFNLQRAMVITYKCAKHQGQRSVRSKVRMETYGWTHRCVDGHTQPIAYPSPLIQLVINIHICILLKVLALEALMVTKHTRTHARTHARTHTHTQPFNGLLSRTTRVGRYQKKHSMVTNSDIIKPTCLLKYLISKHVH